MSEAIDSGSSLLVKLLNILQAGVFKWNLFMEILESVYCFWKVS